jgi:hypothetical protein
VDGKRMVLSPDQPEVSSVTAAVRRDGTGLVLTASDKAHDVHFGLFVTDSHIAPGDFPIGECGDAANCSTHSKPVMLGAFPTGQLSDYASMVAGYDHPALGLKPLVLTLAKVDDVLWPGVGPAKRIKGEFKGGLARIERDAAGLDHVAGPVRQVEGRFDLYAALR